MRVAKLLLNLSLRKTTSKVNLKNQSNLIKFSSLPASIHFRSKYQFSSAQQLQLVFNKDIQQDLHKLELEYRATQNFSIFESTIKNSTGILDQMKIFKIYKVMEGSPYNDVAYNNIFQTVKVVKKKSDNMLLLLASIKKRIAQHHIKQKQYESALKCFEEALDILQNSMVPPLFPYYSIYRQFGLLHDTLGEKGKAKEILTEAVDILDDFVSHSDDKVSTNDYCKKQATAYNALARIDSENKNKWIDKANQAWKNFAQQRFKQIEYAKTVALNLQTQLKSDKEKGEAYYHFNLYKFENKEFKEMLKKAKQQAGV